MEEIIQRQINDNPDSLEIGTPAKGGAIKNYEVVTTRSYYATVTYIVEANNEEEALARIADAPEESLQRRSVPRPAWDGTEEVQSVTEVV